MTHFCKPGFCLAGGVLLKPRILVTAIIILEVVFFFNSSVVVISATKLVMRKC